ncbi:MAG: DUF5654 family protein [Candidatus Atabeyarchaeum deiterrae]
MSDSEEKSTRDRLKKYVPTDVLQKVPWSEVRKQMITSIGTAFGITIGFVWTQVVVQAFNAMGILTSNSLAPGQGLQWLLFAFGAVMVTIVCVYGMLLVAKRQAKEPQK